MGSIGSKFRTTPRAILAAQIVLWGVAMCSTTAQAQLVPSVSGDSAPEEDGMERAKRQADNVMRWIKVHADKPRAAPAAPAPTPPPAPAVTRHVAPRPAPAPAPEPVAPEPQKAEVAAPPPTEIPVAAPAVAPAPVVAPPAIAPIKAPEPPPEPKEEEEVPLKSISQAKPSIPGNVLSALNAGKVMVRFTVEPSGSTSNVEVLSSSSRRLNTPTITAVSSWKFEPIKAARTAQVEFDFLSQ